MMEHKAMYILYTLSRKDGIYNEKSGILVKKGEHAMTCKEAVQFIMPYINDEMTDKEVEAFLEHIKGCRECYEELEVNYTIYAGLAQLDSDSDDFDMQNLLENAIQESEGRVRAHKNFNVVYVLSQIVAILSLFVLIVMKWR